MDKKILALLILALLIVSVTVPMVIAGRPPRAKKECNDGIDNDGDGDIDLADAGCDNKGDNDESNCGDAVCEGEETCSNCEADCGPCDSCSDTDGGIEPTFQGTVSGDQGGNPYEYTDFCLSNTTVTEYYCAGVGPSSIDMSCLTNATTQCSNGACT